MVSAVRLLQWKKAGEGAERERIQSLVTHRPHYTVLRRFVDERWTRHFAGLASTTIAHQKRIWTLKILILPPATIVSCERFEAFPFIWQSTQDEGGGGLGEKWVANKRSIGGAASIPSQGVVFFHEEIFGSCF